MGYVKWLAGSLWKYIQRPETTNLVMAVATVVIALFTWFSYKVVKNGADDNKKLIAAAQTQADVASVEPRAWVGVLGVDSVNFDTTNGLTAIISFYNSGKTPARNVQVSLRYLLSPIALTGPKPELVSGLPFRSAQSIPPQGRYNLYVGKTSGEAFTQDQASGFQRLQPYLPSVRDKKVFLYYFGVLKYDDNLGNHRETQYCLFLADAKTKQTAMCDSFNDLN
jgi:hypothetical protein